jgi:adenine-specific DNA glycosylase
VRERTGIEVAPGAALGSVRHAFSHIDLRLELVALEDRGGRLATHARSDAKLCGRADAAQLPLSALMKKVLALSRPSW